MQKEAERQKQRHHKLKDGLEKVCESHQDAAAVLKSFSRHSTGRPRIEVDQPELLESELTKLGFKLSRSATHLRLLPRRGNTLEGKRHVQTVPVRLIRPENSLRKKNIDRMYAKLFMDDMQNIWS